MSEVNTRKRLAVGIFISIGLAILLVTIFTIGGQHKTFVKMFHLHVIFDDVQGLQSGNNIWLSGMKVGTVSHISFYGNSQVEVVLNIEEKAQPHIRKDSKARISTDGLVGNKIVIIEGGSDSAPPIANNDRLNAEHLAGTQEMFATLQASGSNLLEITGNLKAISKKISDGQGTLGQLINDPAIADQMRSSVQHLRTATAGSEAIIANLENFSERLRRSDGLANQLITDTTVFSRLKGAIVQLNLAADQASQFTASLRTAGQNLNNKTSPVGVLLNDEDAAADLQRTLKNLRVSSKELSDDLEAVQHSFLLRGFFKKKNKE
ncbi:MAG TPA: MlaD family protein [Puia sp.]|jgi:phospholipid/cholesterol/gamma-HCH transport system substrate-binding protein|nr:MlaD family protein [Puia sp.]